MAEDETDTTAAPGRRLPTTLIAAIVGGVVGAALVGGVVLAFAGTGGSSKRPSTPVPSTSASAGASASASAAPSLTGAAAELIQQLTAGATVSYHARYSLVSPQTANKATVTLELWRRPPDVRQDTVVTTGGVTTDTAAFQGTSGVVQCSRQGKGDFACRRTSVSGLSSPQALAASAATQLAGATVTKSTTTVAGRPATCFDLALDGKTTDVCVDAQGVPVRISSAGSTMTLLSIDQTFASGVFTVPTAVS